MSEEFRLDEAIRRLFNGKKIECLNDQWNKERYLKMTDGHLYSVSKYDSKDTYVASSSVNSYIGETFKEYTPQNEKKICDNCVYFNGCVTSDNGQQLWLCAAGTIAYTAFTKNESCGLFKFKKR